MLYMALVGVSAAELARISGLREASEGRPLRGVTFLHLGPGDYRWHVALPVHLGTPGKLR